MSRPAPLDDSPGPERPVAVQLMLDVWKPHLTDADKDLANELLSGLPEYCAPNG